jgi:hypothetical protein
MLKNRECWTRFLSLHGESTCLAPPGGAGNGPSRVLLCRSVAELGGAHSLFRCVPIIRRDRWPPGLVTYIYNSSQHRLNGVGLEPEQRKRRLRNGLRDFNGAIPATTDKGELSLPPATTAATTRSVTQTLRPTSLPKNGYGAASTAALQLGHAALIYQERFLMRLCCYLSAASLFAGTPF